MYYDLHTHTCHSDGTLTAGELLSRAQAGGVRVIAITDHDCTDSLAEAAPIAASLGMSLVPGAEISVTWRAQTLHIVGLRIDTDNIALQAGLTRLRQERDRRAHAIAAKLEKSGVRDALAGAARYASGAVLSRTHFARFLVEGGHVRDMRAAFKEYLGAARPAYVAAQWASLEEAVGWINGAGGQAVIAHPARYRLSSGGMRRLLDEFKAVGGAAIEVISGSHGPEDQTRFAALAKRFDLAASAGSDYHGPEQAWIELGRLPSLPPGCVPVWERWGAH